MSNALSHSLPLHTWISPLPCRIVDALVPAHLVLPALTSLCLISVPVDRYTNGGIVQDCLVSVMRYIHGPPGHSASAECAHLQLWKPPPAPCVARSGYRHLGSRSTCLPGCDRLPTRVKLSFQWRGTGNGCLEIFETMMAALPLDGLLNTCCSRPEPGRGPFPVLAPPLSELASAPPCATGEYVIT